MGTCVKFFESKAILTDEPSKTCQSKVGSLIIKRACFRFEDEDEDKDENEDQGQLLLTVRMLKSVTVMA